MTTSFPYLKIATEHDVPYGEVIRYVAGNAPVRTIEGKEVML